MNKFLIKYSFVLFLSSFSITVTAQATRRIVKDFDFDLKKDTISINSDMRTLECSLSTQHYKKIISKTIRHLNFGNMLVATKKGFEFWNDYGRSGFINVFEYNKTDKKMQLVGMKRTDYELSGTYPGKNGGKSSVDLLTNKYSAQFNVVRNNKIVKLPLITGMMVFPKTYLQTFSDDINFSYEEKCVAIYNSYQLKNK
ncbi:hypothetical protein [Pedobacter alluvionis]|uniref:Uncharacterized protein n=1 Tax=Pedobacter alluvionis TaxID=475253 RepID=A0A497Y8Z4_9SPHI|nr:hypothetical protein [Pedobacter alluvionis]RLJ79675.1 hypothetical protein BCL90_0384 [Pedobacter alluvionis]TFB31001.1 hypothetical protein E3V97_10280 [Pedobacter alluvionis]